MAVELLPVNDSVGSLHANINNSVTSLQCDSFAGLDSLPSGGNFRIRIGTELMLVTGVSGTTLTVTRGDDGTTAASHTALDVIYFLLTRGGLSALLSDRIQTAAYSSEPAAASAGRIFLPSDGQALWRDTGAAWAPWGPIFPLTKPPLVAGFTQVNATGAGYSVSWTDQAGGIAAVATNNDGNSAHLSAMVIAQPSRPYSITAMILPALWHGATFTTSIGLCFYNTSSGKFVTYGYRLNTGNAPQLAMSKYATTNSSPSDYGTNNVCDLTMARFLKIQDDATNFNLFHSADGVNFIKTFGVSRTDYLTPDKVGWFLDGENSNALAMTTATLISWQQGV